MLELNSWVGEEVVRFEDFQLDVEDERVSVSISN